MHLRSGLAPHERQFEVVEAFEHAFHAAVHGAHLAVDDLELGGAVGFGGAVVASHQDRHEVHSGDDLFLERLEVLVEDVGVLVAADERDLDIVEGDQVLVGFESAQPLAQRLAVAADALLVGIGAFAALPLFGRVLHVHL